MADLASIQDRFCSFIYLRDVHAMEWFEDFDRLRSGRVSVQQFHRVFDTIRFLLNDQEFEVLSQAYLEPDGKVNYRRFLETVEDVFSNRELERQPGAGVVDGHLIVTKSRGIPPPNEDAKFRALLAKLYHQVVTRGIYIRESYEDFDRHNNGTVTQSQFFRALPFRDLTGEEMQMLVKRYADPILRDVNYRRLITDVNNFGQSQKPKETFSQSTGLLPHQLQSIKIKNFERTPEDLMREFASHVREKRVRIREFFKQHDPLNQGLVPRSKFEGVLTLFGFTFQQSELDYLADKYAVEIDWTQYDKYAQFCDDVFALGGVVEETLKTRSVATVEATKTPAVEAVLNKIREKIVKFRMNTLPTMQDFDRLGRGYITKLQLHRALSTLGIQITTQELDILATVYEQENGIDFYKFIEDVDPTHKQERRAFKPIGTSRQSIEAVYGQTPTGDKFVTPDQADDMIYQSKKGLLTKVGEKHDIDSLLFEMKKWSYLNSVDFHDFLSDFDRHNIGEITEGQFRTGIGLATYKLTDPEFELIRANYASDRRAGYIRWRQFADDIIQAIAPMDLEKTPETEVAIPKDTFNPRTRVVQSRDTVPPNVKNILELVARCVKTRRISLIEQFKDKDRFNHKRVTPSAFAQVLQLIGVHLSKAEIDVLCQHYYDASVNFVDYTLFVADIDAMVGLIFGDRASTSLVAQPIPEYNNKDCDYIIARKASGSPLTWDELKQKIQSFIYKRRIRIEDFFLSFDHLRSGKVTDQKFRSFVGQTGIPLTPEEIEFLIGNFRVPGTTDMVDYRTFCHQLNKIFGKRELVKKPVAKDKPKLTAMPDPSATITALDFAEERKMHEILARMRTAVVTRRMNIREQFEDYDRAPHKNYITKQQFKQCIARLGLSSDPREFDVLCKRYRCTDLDDVNYHAFCDDIDKD